MVDKTKILDLGGLTVRVKELAVGYNKPSSSQSTASTSGFSRVGRQHVVPICGNAKVGATAGWVITGATDKSHATLPAGVTAGTLVVPITGLCIGDTLTAVSVMGQAESAGNTATLTLDVRKQTNAAADNTDASLGTDGSGNITADTIISSSNVAVTGLTEVLAEGEIVYALLTGTTAASTDLDITGLLVTVTSV